MLMPASSEFVALCQAQVGVLTQGLGATASVVYVTAELADGTETNLIPVVAYPETAAMWEENAGALLLPEKATTIDALPELLLPEPPTSDVAVVASPLLEAVDPAYNPPDDRGEQENASSQAYQVVLPLLHEGAVMGLLVTGRQDRPWNQRERTQIDRVARSLAIARILDRQAQWLGQTYHRQKSLRSQQRDRLDDLLHQFRNPLTALRTLGKLLLKRLQPNDRNRAVATSIIQESQRLQALLQQFDQTANLAEEELPLALPAPLRLTNGRKSEERDEAGSPAVENLPVLGAIASAAEPRALLPGIPSPPASGLLGKPLKPVPCAIAPVLEPLLTSATAIAQDRNLQLHSKIPQDLPPLQVDAQALREILSNLIDNALKYTPAGGQIALQVWSPPHQTSNPFQVLAISDTGPGIPQQDLEQVFERHYRGIQATTEIPGTGLGLAIARALIRQMGGDIRVFSPAQPLQTILATEEAAPMKNTVSQNSSFSKAKFGPGSTFVVWLPEQPIQRASAPQQN